MTGVPARRSGWMCQCGVKLDFGDDDEAVCRACGKRYEKLSEESIRPV